LPGGLGQLRTTLERGRGIRPSATALQVTFRQGGERCRPAGREHHHLLKKLLQERGVPPWERERLPLLRLDGELVAIADLWVCEPFAAGAEEMGWVVHWDRFAIETEGENEDNLSGLAP
jgi:tRNA(Ile)-lysidine synthase